MHILGVITARGGSKGLPGKNLRPLGGIPLIGWSIRAAARAKLLTRAIVSTDDAAIAAAARDLGAEVPFMRPAELATDTASILSVVQHAVGWADSGGSGPDIVVLIQPTTPLRTSEEIDALIRLVTEGGADSAQTVNVDHSHPLHRFRLEDGGRLKPLFTDMEACSQRGEAPVVYKPNGGPFVMRRRFPMEEGRLRGPDHRGLVCPFETCVDIDDIWDLRLAELVLKHRAPAREAA